MKTTFFRSPIGFVFSAMSLARMIVLIGTSLLMGRLPAQATLDSGIDPNNLGKGEWVYVLSQATNQLGGYVPSVTTAQGMMNYFASHGMQWVTIKAGTGGIDYPSPGSPQLTPAIITAAHNAGLKIFAYTRSYGTNVQQEITLATNYLAKGCDGFIIDAEIEWESATLPDNTTKATQLCQGIKNAYPNRFLAHSPFWLISSHSTFPYKEFGYYCDAVMPQAYWYTEGGRVSDPNYDTPQEMVDYMNNEWRNWQNGLAGQWTNSIKPISPIASAYNTSMPASEITDFYNALRNSVNPPTGMGYRSVNFYRAGGSGYGHTAAMWTTIGADNLYATNGATLSAATVEALDISATIHWESDILSDSVVEYGATISYGTSVTNATFDIHHTIVLTNLSPSTTYHFRVKSKDLFGNTTTSSDGTFTTNPEGVVYDIIIDNTDDKATVVGTWAAGSSGSQFYGTDYRYKSAGTGSAYVEYRPAILVTGNYEVFAWYPAGSNRPTDAPYVVNCSTGSTTNYVNQQVSGGQWNSIGIYAFAAGTAGTVQIVDKHTSGSLMADAIKFVFKPVPPSITNQPQNQVVNHGTLATFSAGVTGSSLLHYQWRKNGSPLSNGGYISGATTSALTISSVIRSDAGTYSVVVTNGAGSVTSANATLTVIDPAILTNPTTQTQDAGATATLTVVASGSPALQYQWQRSSTNLSDGGRISGVLTSALAISGLTLADAGTYRVIVNNSYGSVTSTVAVLTVDASPVITSQPQSQTVPQGSTAAFTVVATGAGPLSYQWRTNGTAISGATGSLLTLNNVGPANDADYTVVVGNSYGSDTSTPPAHLTVILRPGISIQPATRTNDAGTVATFTVTATGNYLNYQWRKDGVDLANGGDVSGATSSMLTISAVAQEDAAFYSVAVSNAAGSTNSNPAQLAVCDGSMTNIIMDNTNATVVGANWVTGTGATDKYGADYRYRTSSSGGAQYLEYKPTIVMAGSYEVYEWHGTVGTTRAPDGPHVVNSTSGLTTNYVNQQVNMKQWNSIGTYTFAAGNSGYVRIVDFQSSGYLVADAIQFTQKTTAPSIASAPTNRNDIVGTTAVFTVLPSGTGPFTYQWKKNGTPMSDGGNVSGATNRILTLSAVSFVDTATYTVVVSNAFGNASSSATLTVTDVAPAITEQPTPVVVATGDQAIFDVQATGTSLTYRWRRNGSPLTDTPPFSGTATATLTISEAAAANAGSYSVVITNNAGSITSSVVTLTVMDPPLITSHPTSRTVDAGATTMFSVTASGTAPLGYVWSKGGVQLNDGGDISGAQTATLTITGVLAADAGDYHVTVTNAIGYAISSEAHLAVNDPIITSQPASRTNIAGTLATFTVAGYGTGALTYQWRKGLVDLANDTRISGATSASLAIADVQTADSGNYSVVVTSESGGAITSSVVALTVIVPPSISAEPQSITHAIGSTAEFMVTATGTAPLSYQWQKGEVNIDGETGTKLTLLNVSETDAGSYRVVVTNVAGSVTSVVATLTVTGIPVITAQPTNLTVAAGSTATFRVVASGDDLSYQWQFQGTNLDGALSSDLTITNVQPVNAGSYSVVVSNSSGSVTSSNAVLTVVEAPQIVSQPSGTTNCAGSTVMFSVTAAGTPPLTYQWKRNGIALWNETNTAVVLNSVQTAMAGTYTVVVANGTGSVTSSNAILGVGTSVTISKQPANVTCYAGQKASLAVTVSGTGLSYQWRLNGTNITGATTNPYILVPARLTDAGSYTVWVSDGAVSGISSAAILTVLADINSPSVSVVVPASGAGYRTNTTPGITNYILLASGKATDKERVEKVYCRINSGDWQQATVASNAASTVWSSPMIVSPGTNTMLTYSEDFSGRVSSTSRVVFCYNQPSPLTIHLTANGTESRIGGMASNAIAATMYYPDNTNLYVGRTYTLAVMETNKPWFVLTNWTDGTGALRQTNNPKCMFVMESNLVLNINFITNPMVKAAGTYNGLFWETNESGEVVRHHSAGYATFTLTPSFAISGKLSLDGNTVGVSGKLRLDGTADLSGNRSKLAKSNLLVSITVSNWNNVLEGTVTGTSLSNETFTSRITADRVVWSTNNLYPQPATYTFVLPNTNNLEAPIGPSYGTLTVKSNGLVVITGKAGDGVALKGAGSVSERGIIPFFVPMYPAAQRSVPITTYPYSKPLTETFGEIIGWLALQPNTNAWLCISNGLPANDAPLGLIDWIKTGNWTNANWAIGFTNQGAIISSRHLTNAFASLGTTNVLLFTNALVRVTGGGVTDFTTSENAVTNAGMKFSMAKVVTNKLSVSLSPTTGNLTGSFTNDATGPVAVKWGGVFLQDYNIGYGSFLNQTNYPARTSRTNGSGTVELIPTR